MIYMRKLLMMVFVLCVQNSYASHTTLTPRGDNTAGIPSGYQISTSDIACESQLCMAVGMARNIDKRDFFPLLLESHNHGQSWQRVNGGFLVDLKGRTGSLYAIKYVGGNWVAVGYYHQHYFPIGHKQVPLILLSKNNGAYWSHFTKGYFLPTAVISGMSDNLACVNRTCIATGQGNIQDDNHLKIPLILRSTNAGESWSVVKRVDHFPHLPMSSVKSPYLAATVCNGLTCLASGNWWTESSPTGVPLLLVSHDVGLTWKVIDNISGLPTNLLFTSLRQLHCANKVCLAGGMFNQFTNARYDNITGLPLLLVSKDDGDSWVHVKQIAELPANFKDATITSITSSGSAWQVEGKWWDDPFATMRLLLTSNDHAQSWVFQGDRKQPASYS